MASSASTSTASIEPAVHTNSTGGNMDKCSAAASRSLTHPTVNIIKMSNGVVKTTHGGYGFTRSTYGCNVATFRCDLLECGATLKTYYTNGRYHVKNAEPHDEELHVRGFRRPPGGGDRTPSIPGEGGKRKAPSCADKPRKTIKGGAQVPAKKSTGRPLCVGSAFSHRPHKQGTPPGKAEGAAGDNSKMKSAKGSGAGNLVDSRAAAVRQSPVHFQHPRGLNEPGTSRYSSDDEWAEENILPPPTPPAMPDHADTVQNDADDGAHSCCISSDNSMNGDVGGKPIAAKHEPGDVNSWDAKAGGKESLDPPIRIASYESIRNDRSAADDSVGMGLGRTQIVLNMKLETGDLPDKELKESVCLLLQAEAKLVALQQQSEALRTELLRKELNFNTAENKISEGAAFGDFSST
ncbi:uncharacterized protein LOC115329331 [Ixodes scapularis]|uniref:uncharacterized protein LOC115329331 n=1 Tax=Ixodes scapularis TaxID=6945 RepID=UPI001C38B760|nr:uncharacterized protein LOC115329331 [Ixodes scapularis]XP_042145513.1 uncharacterized protein LOC115329331 [Ixodes scapularis]